MIDPTLLTEYSIQNYKEPNKKAIVTPLRLSLNLTEKDFQDITTICNQPIIYEFIFNEKLFGRPYIIDTAHDFLTKAEEGWKTNAYFTFIIRDESNKVIGAIDIKSNNPIEAEVAILARWKPYWIYD